MLDYTTFSFIIKPFIILISDFHQFSDINISQGSEATHLSVVGYLNMNLLQIYHRVSHLKNFENRLIFGGSYGQEFSVLFF